MKHLPGFELAGYFRWVDGEYLLQVTDPLPASLGLYAFVQSGTVRYVGAADNLRRRLRRYARRQLTLKSKRPVHGLLHEAMGIAEVAVFVRPFKKTVQRVRGLPINMAIGLEAGLIATLNPEWNRRGRSLVLELPSGNIVAKVPEPK